MGASAKCIVLTAMKKVEFTYKGNDVKFQGLNKQKMMESGHSKFFSWLFTMRELKLIRKMEKQLAFFFAADNNSIMKGSLLLINLSGPFVGRTARQRIIAPTRNWRFSAPQTRWWLIKVWFSAPTVVVKIATFAKPENVVSFLLKTKLIETL
nr:hypothetical protein [Bacteroidota bacterium]